MHPPCKRGPFVTLGPREPAARQKCATQVYAMATFYLGFTDEAKSRIISSSENSSHCRKANLSIRRKENKFDNKIKILKWFRFETKSYNRSAYGKQRQQFFGSQALGQSFNCNYKCMWREHDSHFLAIR
ncbi:hypothetical protein NPIL_35821 [Nephila pilipes]|uniref:Uncharacterized protein n=1 Tax=Nephila pilipes TaxID=299642 RepID=A0A8X6NHY3_NEPPI|nr:hypothetical protein NPIL_35821 [Nephila pilipes]